MIDFAHSLAGFFVGAVVGLTGVGGGSLMTPLLVLLFGIHPATAVGTDLLYAAITKAGGTCIHARKGNVEWRIVRYLSLGSMPAAALTLILVQVWAPGGMGNASRIITFALGAALVLTAAALIFRRRLRQWAHRNQGNQAASPPRAWKTMAIGALLGVLVSISSVGAGALGVTALFFLYPRLASHRIVGSDVAHAVPLALIAGCGHWLLGGVDWALLGALLLGSIPGIYLGSTLSSRIPEHVLCPTLAFVLALVGGRLIAF